MYEWLTVFVLWCACLHVRAVIKKDMGAKKFLLPLMAVNYCGFLTRAYGMQYKVKKRRMHIPGLYHRHQPIAEAFPRQHNKFIPEGIPLYATG